MEKRFIRIWSELEIEDIAEHLIVIGELKGTCNKCQALGLDLTSKACPACNTEFKYATFISAHDRGAQFNKMRAREGRVAFVDYDDFKKAIGEVKAKKFLQ